MPRMTFLVAILAVPLALTLASLESPVLKQSLYGWMARHRAFDGGAVRVFHDFGHVFAYTTAAVILVSVSRGRQEMAASISALLAIAFLTEIGQHYLYHVPVEWTDIRADLFGIVLAAATLMILRRLHRIGLDRTAEH